MITSGRLTVKCKDDENKKTITSISIKRVGHIIRVELQTSQRLKAKRIHSKPNHLISPKSVGVKTSLMEVKPNIKMFPMPLWRISLMIKEYIESQRFLDFLDLLESVKPLSEERGITEFDGKTVHPISIRTLLSEFRIYSRGLVNRRKRECRTLILLDRSLSMVNPWSPWDEIPKIKLGQFLARVIQMLQFNNHLFSFGKDVREEEDPYTVRAVDEETRLDLALKEADLYNPEHLIIITDGRPIYSKNVPLNQMSRECMHVLDTLSHSGVTILVILLGREPEMLNFYETLGGSSGVSLLDLSVENHGLVKMVHTISRYIYEHDNSLYLP